MPAVGKLQPWAWVYIRLMAKMPGDYKCREAVAQFVICNGLVIA